MGEDKDMNSERAEAVRAAEEIIRSHAANRKAVEAAEVIVQLPRNAPNHTVEVPLFNGLDAATTEISGDATHAQARSSVPLERDYN